MKLNDYQEQARSTAVYPMVTLPNGDEVGWVYLALNEIHFGNVNFDMCDLTIDFKADLSGKNPFEPIKGEVGKTYTAYVVLRTETTPGMTSFSKIWSVHRTKQGAEAALKREEELNTDKERYHFIIQDEKVQR